MRSKAFTFCLCTVLTVASGASAFGQDWAGLMNFFRQDIVNRSPLSGEDKEYCINFLDSMEQMERDGFQSLETEQRLVGAFYAECGHRLITTDGLSFDGLQAELNEMWKSARGFADFVLGQTMIAKEPLPDNRLLVVAAEDPVQEASCTVDLRFLVEGEGGPYLLVKDFVQITTVRELVQTTVYATGSPPGGSCRWEFDEELGFVPNPFGGVPDVGLFPNPTPGMGVLRVIYTAPNGAECEDAKLFHIFKQ